MNLIDRLLTTLKLAKGSHKTPGRSMCIMECEAFIAGEAHSDRPDCVSPSLGNAARSINDWMTQKERDEWLAPMLGQFAGTRGTAEHERKRAYIAADYAVRVFAPMALRAHKREDLALRMESCAKIVDKRTAVEANRLAKEVRAAAAAAYADADAAAAAAYAAAAAAAYAADADAAYATAKLTLAAAAYAADARKASRRIICGQLVKMLREMIDVYTAAPKEWARDPATLPCLAS
jgi:hypothetical protein